MTDIAFYHLEKWPLERALPKLLEKTLQAGERALVVASSAERVEALAQLLWSYEAGSWLPHGAARDGRPDEQPIFLSDKDDNPNGARFLFLVDGATSARLEAFARCFVLFDGTTPDAVQAAREQWKAWREAGHALTYWRQTPGGGWEKKAEAQSEPKPEADPGA